MRKHIRSDRDLSDIDQIQQVEFYDRLQERCDELASQLYATETKCQNWKREAEFYRKLYEVGVAPILSNV